MNSADNRPHFIIKRNFQKRDYTYEDILSENILSEICRLSTGRKVYSIEWDDKDYNKGRLVKLIYKDKIHYITLSNEGVVAGRNSAFQSVPSAMNRFILDESKNKQLSYYFLPDISGSFSTTYFMFMYRLMKTANVNFLNSADFIIESIIGFASPADIIAAKNQTRSRNRSNKSTYVTAGPENQIQIFGKTYGASKYETTILCHAISAIAQRRVELYEIEEGGLNKLPAKSKSAIKKSGKISIFSSSLTIERDEFVRKNSLRSIRYVYNLLEKLGDKRCSLCDCKIPQIIQGAHIWPVAEIKKQKDLSDDEKLSLAIDGDNGLWLCQNHHKLFDVNLIAFKPDGSVFIHSSTRQENIDYIKSITNKAPLFAGILNEPFIKMLGRRNVELDFDHYQNL